MKKYYITGLVVAPIYPTMIMMVSPYLMKPSICLTTSLFGGLLAGFIGHMLENKFGKSYSIPILILTGVLSFLLTLASWPLAE
jgi:hypothetical protein